ncbi:MAG: terminase large subunit domain-containing protein [Maioricimonas sp. JB045]
MDARIAPLHPRLFRQVIRIDRSDGPVLAECMQPWQQRDFAALDAAWLHLAGRGEPESAPAAILRRAYVERPRGHSKTSDTAVQVCWILLAARAAVSGLAAAADREQAQLIHDAIRRLARLNGHLCGDLTFTQHQIRNRRTLSCIDIISSDVASSWGQLPDFVICDELCHWTKQDLWNSLVSSAAKKPDCVLTVLTNAGIGRGWQWDVREHARTHPAWHFSTLDGPHAPWITDAWLDEQRALLPPNVFERLWMNRWQHSDGEFVSLAEAEACRDESLVMQSQGQPGVSYVATIDYAEKHDLTVGCVCHFDGSRVVVDRMDVVRPSPTSPTPVAWVERWIHRTAAGFGDVCFVVDPYQLVGLIQQLEHQYDIRRFEFAGGQGNHRLTLCLRQLILHLQVAWYPACGAIASDRGRDDLETELASLVVHESAGGRLRLDHLRDGVHHDDRSFTLGVACLHLMEGTVAPATFEVTGPLPGGGFAW